MTRGLWTGAGPVRLPALFAVAVLALVSCGSGGSAGGSGAVRVPEGRCIGFTDEAVELVQRSFDGTVEDAGEALPDSTDPEAVRDLLGRASAEGCVQSSVDFPSLVCPGIDRLTTTGDAAEEDLAALVEICRWSPDGDDVAHAALARCEPGSGEVLASPVPETDRSAPLAEAQAPFLDEGFRYTDERFELREGVPRHELTLNVGVDGVFQGLSLSTEDGATTWNEFHSEDPMWSQRSESEPWTTRDEAGAFEPPYQFAFFYPVQTPTALAGYADIDWVFEGTIERDGDELLQFCADHSLGLSLGPPVGLSATRYVAHPDGYVVEFVEASISSIGRFCFESALEIGNSIEVPGLGDSPPPDHVVDLNLLPQCGDLVRES